MAQLFSKVKSAIVEDVWKVWEAILKEELQNAPNNDNITAIQLVSQGDSVEEASTQWLYYLLFL